MFVLGQFFASLALLFDMVFKMLYFLLVVRILISWFPVDPYNEFVRALNTMTEPILEPLRRLPLRLGMFDLSPVIAFVLLTFLDSFVVGILRRLALQFGAG